MKADHVHFLKEWLGPEGAISGLVDSHLTNTQLYDLAIRLGGAVDKRAGRRELSIEVVNANENRIDKTNDELLAMNSDEIIEYLDRRLVSNVEIIRKLHEFDITPRSEAKKKLRRFMAQEISDLGLYSRVAKGDRRAD